MITQDYAKALVATHFFINVSPRASKIACALNVSPIEIYAMAETDEWKDALDFWGASDITAKPNRHHNRDKNRKTNKRVQAQLQKPTLFETQQGICNGCKAVFGFDALTVDHIIPLSKEGTNDIDNLQLLCRPCNALKGDGTQAMLLAKIKRQTFFRGMARAANIALTAITLVSFMRVL